MGWITKISAIFLTLFFVSLPLYGIFFVWFFSNIVGSYKSLSYILINLGIFGILAILSPVIFGFLVLSPFYHYGFGLWKHKSRFFDSYSRIISTIIFVTFLIIMVYSYILRPFSISIGDILILILSPLTWILILIIAIPFYYGWLKKPTENQISDIKITENNTDSSLNLEQK